MPSLPDLEGLAIFAKVVEFRSFSGAADDLRISKATVSKAVSRLEDRLGTRLFNRTSRRLALTDAGRRLTDRATLILLEGEAAESECLAQSSAPRGLVRLAAPMSFGLREVAPRLPAFLLAHPEVSVDLHLSDALVDLIGEGFDLALRIGVLSDSSLIARRLRPIARHIVASPGYLASRGHPAHPLELADHACLGYAYQQTRDLWRFVNAEGQEAVVHPKGPLRVTNGDALIGALEAGLGIALLPEFIVADALASGRLQAILPEWSCAASALHMITPAGGPRPARVTALAEFLAVSLSAAGISGSSIRQPPAV